MSIEIYTSPYCGYCMRAKRLLKGKGVDFDERDVSRDATVRDEMTRRADGRTSVPQIFVNGKHIGGCDDLMALDKAGKLDPMIGLS